MHSGKKRVNLQAMKKLKILLCVMLLLLASCGERKKVARPAGKDLAFPQLSIPAAYTDSDDRLAYAVNHYWDDFFKGDGRTDSARVLGVPKPQVEQGLANYIAILESVPLNQAQDGMSHLDRISPAAEEIGAVNTIVNSGGILAGENTDVCGIEYALSGTDAGGDIYYEIDIIKGAPALTFQCHFLIRREDDPVCGLTIQAHIEELVIIAFNPDERTAAEQFCQMPLK